MWREGKRERKIYIPTVTDSVTSEPYGFVAKEGKDKKKKKEICSPFMLAYGK